MFDECFGGEVKQEEKMQEPKLLLWTFVSSIKILGKIEMKMSELLSDDIFDDLSKHNPLWESEHERENELLQACRFRLMHLQDKLLEMALLLENDDERMGS